MRRHNPVSVFCTVVALGCFGASWYQHETYPWWAHGTLCLVFAVFWRQE